MRAQCPGYVHTSDLSSVTTTNARYFWWTDGGANESQASALAAESGGKTNATFANGVYKYGNIDLGEPPVTLTANLSNASAAGVALDLSTRCVR